MHERYDRWKPIDGIPGELVCEGIHDDWEGFRILLRSYEDLTTPMIRILFDSAIIGYRNINESYRNRTTSQHTEIAGWSLFTVENSQWLAGLRDEAIIVLDKTPVTHYAVYGIEYFIDVASQLPPKVSWLEARDCGP